MKISLKTILRRRRDNKIILCSDCFKDEGLKLDAFRHGLIKNTACPNCKSFHGNKLNFPRLEYISHRFFVKGTLFNTDYGECPQIQMNPIGEPDDLDLHSHLLDDLKLIQSKSPLVFFYYGPREWMLGEIEPLKSLQSSTKRKDIIERIIREYPTRYLKPTETFYRLRLDPTDPEDHKQYDSSPNSGNYRLDSPTLPILYASQDLEVCVHECRATVQDNIFLASLQPTRDLLLLDLTEVLREHEYVTEFESLDLAVQMLFSAGSHSYEICRDIAKYVHEAGYDGIIYPSYFSKIRTGKMSFETVYGVSIRKFPQYSNYAKSLTIPNLALFGKPIEDGKVMVKCINKIALNKVDYDIRFGPVKY